MNKSSGEFTQTLKGLRDEHSAVRRRVGSARLLMALWLLLTIGGGFAIAIVWWPGGIRVLWIGLLAALPGAMWHWKEHIQKPRSEYEKHFKHDVIARLVPLILDGAAYQPDAGLPENELLDGLLDQHASRVDSEDLIAGQHAGMDYALCEARAYFQVPAKAGGSRRQMWQRAFRGVLLVADLPSAVRPTVRLVPAKRPIWSGPRVEIVGKHQIATGNAEFDEEFLMYVGDSNDDASALTAEVKATLLALLAPGESRAWLAIENDRLLLALEQDVDRFEPPPLRKGGEAFIDLDARRWVEEIGAIKKILDAMASLVELR